MLKEKLYVHCNAKKGRKDAMMKAYTAHSSSAQYLPSLGQGIQGWLVNLIEVYNKNEPSTDILIIILGDGLILFTL